MIKKKIKMDLSISNAPQVVYAVQGDTNTRSVVIDLYNSGAAWTVPDDASGVVKFKKADGKGGIYDKLPNGVPAVVYEENSNQIEVFLAPQMLTFPGEVKAQVSLIYDNNIISTFSFVVLVQADPSANAENSTDYVNWDRYFIPQTSGATVGQYLKITKVDSLGRVIEVSPVDAPKNPGEMDTDLDMKSNSIRGVGSLELWNEDDISTVILQAGFPEGDSESEDFNGVIELLTSRGDEPVVIRNVADAKNPNEAVTKKQLDSEIEKINSNPGGYILPVASPEKLGGVKPIVATKEMTQDVGVDENGRLFTNPIFSGIDKKTITAYDAGAVRPFLRYDTFWDVINPMFATKHINERALNNSVSIINDGATVHEVVGVLSPNGRYVYITYLKNIDGTTADVGSTSESGTSKIYFTAAYNTYGVTSFTPAMSETTVELFAKGQELADATTIDTGGPSMPTLYSDGTTLFAVCCFAGNGFGGYVRTADISENPAPEDVVWSTAQPWKLSIDGENGDFDMNRLNGWTDATWQTNNQIVWESTIGMFIMAICVEGKAAVLVKSKDGINWEYTNTVYTDYLCKFQCEAAVFRQSTSNIWIAVRNGNTGTNTSKLACGNKNYLTVFKVSATGAKIEEYNIPDAGVKPWFIPVPSGTKHGAYLLHNAQSRYSVQVEYIGDYYPGMTLGEMYGIATNYCCGVVGSTAATNTSIMLMGTTGLVTEKTGASLVYDIRLGKFLDSATSLETIQNIVTRAIDTEVTKDSTNLITSGAVKKALNTVSGAGGAVWVNVANETLEAEASGFTEITLEEPRTIRRMRIYAEVVGSQANQDTMNDQLTLLINGKVVASSLGAAVSSEDSKKKYVFFDVDITSSGSFSKGYVQTYNGSTWSSDACNQFSDYISSETDIETIKVQTYNGWKTIGVGSKMILDIQ